MLWWAPNTDFSLEAQTCLSAELKPDGRTRRIASRRRAAAYDLDGPMQIIRGLQASHLAPWYVRSGSRLPVTTALLPFHHHDGVGCVLAAWLAGLRMWLARRSRCVGPMQDGCGLHRRRVAPLAMAHSMRLSVTTKCKLCPDRQVVQLMMVQRRASSSQCTKTAIAVRVRPMDHWTPSDMCAPRLRLPATRQSVAPRGPVTGLYLLCGVSSGAA